MKCPACGADFGAQDHFCSACGTPRPRLAAKFETAALQYAALRAAHGAGDLASAAYEAALLKPAVQDEAGSYWSPGADSGEWYRFEGSQWIRREPPLAGTAPRPDPPPGAPVPAQVASSSAVALADARALAPGMLPGLLLFLGWGAGWLAGYGLALAADVLPLASAQVLLMVAIAGIVAAPILPRPGRGYSPMARLGFLIFWPALWAIGWLGAGFLQAAIGAGMRIRGNGVQMFSLTGGAIGGALLGALLMGIFRRQGVGQASKRYIREQSAHA